MPKKKLSVAPAFKLVLFVVIALTLVSLAASILLALSAPQTDEVKKLIDACSTMYKAGFGAILGLLGGKVLP